MSLVDLAILRTLVLGLLGASLAVFIVWLSWNMRRGRALGGDFGLPFSLFIAAWIATEIIAAFAVEAWMEAYEVLHLAVLLGLAAWMNLRWRWALRTAVEDHG